MNAHSPTPSLAEFLSWPIERIAAQVREESLVCVFPINGTRRWFMLEYPELAGKELAGDYLAIAGQRHVELYRLFLEHGVETLLTPIFGPDLLDRGDEYRKLMVPALMWFARDPVFLRFYDQYGVRVRVYGDARRTFAGTPYEAALDAFDELQQRTAQHTRFRLFFGVCAHDPAETVAEIGVSFQQARGRLPTKPEIVEAYYGEAVNPVSLFIGFDRPTAFDMPLIATGSEDLYFTVSPSPYLDEQTLRSILHDHLHARRIDDSGYEHLTAEDIQAMQAFYRQNQHSVLGLGKQHRSGAFWYPTTQVSGTTDLE